MGMRASAAASPGGPRPANVRRVAAVIGVAQAWPIALLLVLAAPVAQATAICRWVDASGRTQVSDTVPERYRARATCTDSQRYELSPEQRRAAQQQAADERARAQAREAAARPPAAPASAPPRPASDAAPPVTKRPATVPTDATDCATWWRLYDESAACFGPYRTARGATRAEAFEVCNVVIRPELRCGPRRD